MMTLAKTLLPWLGIFASVLFSLFLVPEALEGIQVSQQAKHYRSTRAEITSQYEKKRDKGPKSYVVEFQYQAQNRKLRGSNRFTSWTDDEPLVKNLVRKEKNGQKTILVYYDPAQPKRVVIHKNVPVWPHALAITITVLCFVLSLFFATTSVKRKLYLKKSRTRVAQRTAETKNADSV